MLTDPIQVKPKVGKFTKEKSNINHLYSSMLVTDFKPSYQLAKAHFRFSFFYRVPEDSLKKH